MNPISMKKTIKGVLYNTDTATLLADNAYWDGSSHERNGRNSFLYKTPTGRYFLVNQTQWEDEYDRLVPVSKDAAVDVYEVLQAEHVEFDEAFYAEPVRE